MYKVTVLTSGKYANVELGERYCLTRKTAIKLANTFLQSGCDITLAKLIRCGDTFYWSEAWEDTHIVFVEDDNECLFLARKANKWELGF